MKITGIKVRQVEVPLIEPFRISLGVITHSRSAIVSVETDEGLVGYGEGAPAILISGERAYPVQTMSLRQWRENSLV